MLATFACHPEKTKGRLYSEQPTPYRNEFLRDKDRIIHSNTFRRLQYKTQVFINHEGDHYRNRLTHSIEVSSVARSLAKALKISDDLAECIALAHDLGHTPFGHAGEDALDDCMKQYGGFCHNAHSIKLLTDLEKRYAAYHGLNLTWEVLEGIAKHNGPLTNDIPLAIKQYNDMHDLKLHEYSSAEAQVAALSDDIAYHCHDLEDGIRANLYDIKELEEIEFLRKIVRDIHEKYHHLEKGRQIYEIVRALAHILIEDLLKQTKANIENYKIHIEEDVRSLGKPLIEFSPEINDYLQQIKKFLFRKVYRHHKVMTVTYKCKVIIKKLFELYFANPGCMPPEWQMRAEGDDHVKARVVADYIAGMTDRYAIKEYNSLYNFSLQSF